MGCYVSPGDWNHTQHSIKYITDVDQLIMSILDEGEVLDEFNHIKNVSENKID
jgi:hypothetical protein